MTSKPTCPECSKPIDPKYRPFCGKRCADVDLHRWLVGRYAIPGAPDDEDAASSDHSERPRDA